MTNQQETPSVIAIYGPTAIGKTAIAIALGEELRRRAQEPVAINVDSMQIYRGLEILSAAPNKEERAALEHCLIGFVDPTNEFSVGQFAPLAHEAIDLAISNGRTPIVVGGTGLYMMGALREMQLLPSVPSKIRRQVEAELESEGSATLHAKLPQAERDRIHPNDRARVARAHELIKSGIQTHQDSSGIWNAPFRHPTVVFGLTMDRTQLHTRIAARVRRMVSQGAFEEAKKASDAGLSRTAQAMIGVDAALARDEATLARDHRRFARRQLTWMRKMTPIEVVDRTTLSDAEVGKILAEIALG